MQTRNTASLKEVKLVTEDLGILFRVIRKLNTELTHRH
jgi:hypothetical protein